MRIKHSQLSRFERSFRWLSVGTMDPEGIRKAAADEMRNLDSPSAPERVHAVKMIGLVCFLELDKPDGVSESLLRLFSHFAQSSPHEDVRFACLDAIFLARDLARLRSLTFESGCLPTNRYRDELARSLQIESYPPMQC